MVLLSVFHKSRFPLQPRQRERKIRADIALEQELTRFALLVKFVFHVTTCKSLVAGKSNDTIEKIYIVSQNKNVFFFVNNTCPSYF